MKILYITNAGLGRPDAPAIRAKGLSAALARKGLDVTLLGATPKTAPIEGVRIGHLWRPPIRKIGALFWHAHLSLRLLARRFSDYDAVLMREAPYTLEPGRFALQKKIPLVLEVNG